MVRFALFALLFTLILVGLMPREAAAAPLGVKDAVILKEGEVLDAHLVVDEASEYQNKWHLLVRHNGLLYTCDVRGIKSAAYGECWAVLISN